MGGMESDGRGMAVSSDSDEDPGSGEVEVKWQLGDPCGETWGNEMVPECRRVVGTDTNE